MTSGYHARIQEHYEKYPYPHYPWYALGSWRQLDAVDTQKWGAKRDIQDIWISGCGTIQPIMFGRRNHFARIWATDLSKNSLLIAKRRLNLLGIRNVHLHQEDIFESKYREAFDVIDSFGVIHHTVSPQKSLQKLTEALRPGGVLRLMVYSQSTRQNLEVLRKEVLEKKIENLADVETFVSSKQVDRRGELSNSMGVADALLNPTVHTFTDDQFHSLIAGQSDLKLLRLDSSSNHLAYLIKTSKYN